MRTHILDWCTCALDGGKKRDEPTDEQGVSRSRIMMMIIQRFYLPAIGKTCEGKHSSIHHHRHYHDHDDNDHYHHVDDNDQLGNGVAGEPG